MVNSMDKLTERQKRILKQVIDGYIDTPDPVASRKLSRGGRIKFSPATIRNEMMELEEKGYLQQPHSSAGRIPTNKAYRFYINYLMELEDLTREEEHKIEEIRKEYAMKRKKIKEVLKNVSHLLSDITHLPGLSITPKIIDSRFQRLRMISLSNNRILLLLQTSEGIMKNLLIRNEHDLSQQQLDDITEKLNTRIKGFRLEEIRAEIMSMVEHEGKIQQDALKTVVEALGVGIESIVQEQDMLVEGASQVINLPEFRNTEKLACIFRLIEEKNELINLLNNCIQAEGVKVLIGSEASSEQLKDLTIVSAPYRIGNQKCGSIGILGPTRVNYSRVITAVSEISKKLTQILEQL